MPLLGSWWAAAIPPTVSVTVKGPSGLSIVLDAKRLGDGNLELVLPEHVMNAFTASVTTQTISSGTQTISSGTSSTNSNRSTTPLPIYTPAPPTYDAPWNNNLTFAAPPAANVPATTLVSHHAIAQPDPQPIAITHTNTAPVYATPSRTAPIAASSPVIHEKDYKMPSAERIWCYWSSGNKPLYTAPSLSAFPSRPEAGDTYVHHPASGVNFEHELWYFWNNRWVKSETGAWHPTPGRGYVLHWSPDSWTVRWMRPGSCQKSRVPWQLRGRS